MNKNPFIPQPATYTPPQPPLPPGPPPPQPSQPDYSAYWAAVQQQQQAQQAPYPQQWAAQPPRPPPEQNALYANYGYGAQWQRQQQHQFQSPPAPIVHPPPPPPAAPGYNPYQPAVSYPQPYVPHAPQAMAQMPYPVSQQQHTPSQPMFNPHLPQPLPTMQQRHGHHVSPQHQPPAKRQRFDGPAYNQQAQQRQPPVQQYQPSVLPNQPLGSHIGPGHARGGAPGSNQVPLGGGRGGGGSRGGSLGNINRGRGGSMNAGRGGPIGNRPNRGGGSFNAGSNPGRGGAGPLRGHNSRGHLGGNKDFHNRRGPGGSFNSGGGGSFSHQNSSFRGRGYGHSNSSRPQRHDGNVSGTFGKDTSASNNSSTSTIGGKKDENRRTLTDFKIVGLEIRSLSWMWGVVSKPPVEAANVDEPSQAVKVEDREEDAPPKVSAGEDTKSEAGDASSGADPAERKDTDANLSKPSHAPTVSGNSPHSRIRIYFHTPVTADDSHPIPQNFFSLGTIPSDSRKGKRKKLDDDEDGDGESGREPPPPPHMNDDRSSVAGSAPSVAETTSEGDWLMAAIVDGEETQHDADAEGDDDDDERLHVSEIVEYHEALSEMGEGEGEDEGRVVSQGNMGVDDLGVVKTSSAGYSASLLDATPSSQGDILNTIDASKDATVNREMDTSAGSPAVVPVPDFVHSAASNRSDAASVSDATPSVHLSHFSRSENHTVDHTERLDSQVLNSLPNSTITEVATIARSGATLTAMTESNVDGDRITAMEGTSLESSGDVNTEAAGSEHLPEPPASPISNTLLSTSSSSTYGDSQSQSDRDRRGNRIPSANRLSISYAGGNRRLVIDAEVVDSVKIYRSEGRIEVKVNVQRDSDGNLEGVFIEGLSDVTKSYAPIQATESSVESDPTLPPFIAVSISMSITLVAYLDTERPLSEPRWVRTGDIPDWLRSMFGRMFWVTGDAAEGWEKKITVVDPDPPPTIWTVLEGWAQNSPVGLANERQRFLKTHMSETENILEILLRLVRGERATAFSSGSTISAPSVSGPLLSALSQGTAHGSQQTHVSLAVLAMFQMTIDYAAKAMGEKGKSEVEERTGEIIRCLPSHLIYKSLDGIFKEWRVERKGR